MLVSLIPHSGVLRLEFQKRSELEFVSLQINKCYKNLVQVAMPRLSNVEFLNEGEL